MLTNKSYENILNDMLSKVTSDVDKREGSIIYDALAPSAYELAQMYFELNNFIDLIFSDTAVGEFLDRRVADFGISRKPSVASVRKIEATSIISIGSRWAIGEVVYYISEILGENSYKGVCETKGSIGNVYSGELKSLDNLQGIKATLTDILISGQDTESDENLRLRFFENVRKPATSGNVYHYEQWALDVPGVGGVKVFPLHNGPGTVKVTVLDKDMQIDSTLETVVFDYIESVRPIGATVTVDTPTAKNINISANIVLNGTNSIEEIKNNFIEEIKVYFKSITFKSPNVSYAMIGAILLSTPGVQDYLDLLVNLGTGNITILDDQVPVIGTISLEV